MDVYEAIESRRSVREYQPGPIDEAALQRILRAGVLAPSARNRQGWKFVVIRDEQRKSRLAREVCEQPWMARASVILAVVSTEPYTMYCGIDAGAVDCAIAIDHMVLAATAEGLGTCWIGHFDQGKCKDLLDVPDSMEIIELLTLGRGRQGQETQPKSRKEISEVVCHERFE
jgi:nitroreductase